MKRFFFASLITMAAFSAEEEKPALFDVEAHGTPSAQAPRVEAWKIVQLDPDYGGMWVLAADLDNDGQVELVSCENHNVEDTHFASTAVAQKLDGSVVWRWGDPAIGRKKWHHDVACQIHDWDGSGKNNVVLTGKDAVIELDGATGQEKRRFAVPEGASDCLVFCNVSGGPRANDMLVKDRYHTIYLYNRDGRLLWQVTDPGGARTAHQPIPIDIDGDGRDEIMAGYSLLNSDGTVRWTYHSKNPDQAKGHLDCARVLRKGSAPDEWRIALTCCGAKNLAVIDGTGKVCWELAGQHFESIDIGSMIPGMKSPQITVDIDHVTGQGPLWVVGDDGAFLGRITTDYSRHHALVDWNGDQLDEVIIAHNRSLYNGKGQCIAVLDGPEIVPIDKYEMSVITGDFTGDGARDIGLVTPNAVYLYKNPSPPANQPTPLGTDLNFTLY